MPPFQRRRSEDEEPRDPGKARRYAMDVLARREHGRAELAKKMATAGFAPDVAAATLDELVADGLQSDARFAEAFVASYARRGKGPVRIEQELTARGVNETLSADALKESGIDWYENARDVRRRKFGAAPPDAFPDRAKQMRFLQYRGFTSEQIAASFDGDDD